MSGQLKGELNLNNFKQYSQVPMQKNKVFGIVGGGIAGSTIALKLSEIGIKSILFEAGPTLVNGPPMCHLHAGGNLYRQISDDQCLSLFKECLQIIKIYPESINRRPTLFTIPKRDNGSFSEILKRLELIKQYYQILVKADPSLALLGDPSQYYKIYSEEDVRKLKMKKTPKFASTMDEWMITPAKQLDLSKLKFPFVMVQEPGWSSLKVAAYANLMLPKTQECVVKLSAKVISIQKDEENNQWEIAFKQPDREIQQKVKVAYLINSCGYKTGEIDDMVGIKQQRMVEFKAAYLAKWENSSGCWPEVIMHGVRDTPHGMAQLTPYSDKYFQIHGMTKEITLFENGLAKTNKGSSMPNLPPQYKNILENEWDPELVQIRTRKAINFVAEFIPSFSNATVYKKPLYGAQQIPGKDSSLRAADITFYPNQYARAEIVKASSSITVAEKLISTLNLIPSEESLREKPYRFMLQKQQIYDKAAQLAVERNYPVSITKSYAEPSATL